MGWGVNRGIGRERRGRKEERSWKERKTVGKRESQRGSKESSLRREGQVRGDERDSRG